MSSSWFTRAAAAAVTPAARLFGIINEEPARDATNEQKIKDAIMKDKKAITPKAIEDAEKAEDGSSLTKNEDNAILQIEKTAKEELEKKMIESMQAFIAAGETVTAFRKQCVDEAVSQFQGALRTYDIKVADETSGAIMGQIAGSWSELLISSTQGDSSVYLSYKTFFFRVNQAIDALLTQCIFLSTKWTQSFPPSSSPHANESYPKVNFGPCFYVVGPILYFQNIGNIKSTNQ